MHLRKQVAVVRGHPDDFRFCSGGRPGSRQALQQPRAERIEFAHAPHVDRDVLGRGGLARGAVNERFKLAGMRRRP